MVHKSLRFKKKKTKKKTVSLGQKGRDYILDQFIFLLQGILMGHVFSKPLVVTEF